MTEKETAEIRRRLTLDKTSVSKIRGCYVNGDGTPITDFSSSLATIPQNEAEEVLAILKKVLSGQPDRNLIDIGFSNSQVIDSPEHKLLMKLRDSGLEDDETVSELFKKVMSVVSFDEKYLILLALDKYDVPVYGKDDQLLEDTDNVFTYILCAVCPVKQTKPALSYSVEEEQFCSLKTGWAIDKPETGFMFPAFDDRQANIYNALFYVKKPNGLFDDLSEEIFGVEPPLPADSQKEVFSQILNETVAEDCGIEVMQEVHSKLSEMIIEHKAKKDEPPLTISKGVITDLLTECKVPDEKVDDFSGEYDRVFGADVRINPKNIVDVKKFEVKTPEVSIKVDPERLDLIKTAVIDGRKCIVISVEHDVEVNGVNINIRPEKTQE